MNNFEKLIKINTAFWVAVSILFWCATVFHAAYCVTFETAACQLYKFPYELVLALVCWATMFVTNMVFAVVCFAVYRKIPDFI